MSAWCKAALGTMLSVSAALGQTAPEAPAPAAHPAPDRLQPGRIVHLMVAGDLDCEQVARDFESELLRAAGAKVSGVLIELDGNRSRPDVVAAMTRALAACPVRTAAYLGDARDRRVGLGQLAIALWCQDTFVAPGTCLRHMNADNLVATLPEDMDPREVVTAWVAEAAGRAESRGIDSRLPSLLWSPVSSAWFVPGDGAGRIEVESPDGPAKQFVFAGGSDRERVELDAALLVSLRLARSTPVNAARALAELGALPGTSRTRITVTSGFADAEGAVLRGIQDLRSRCERAEEALRVTTTKLDRRPLAKDYRGAGERALSEIERAEHVLAETRGLTARFPEVLRDEPATPASGRARQLESIERELSDLRARAEEYRTRR